MENESAVQASERTDSLTGNIYGIIDALETAETALRDAILTDPAHSDVYEMIAHHLWQAWKTSRELLG